MKPLCLIPWVNMRISPRGEILPCCKYKVDKSLLMNIEETTIEDYINSDFLNNIKDTMLKNEWPTGCIRCKSEEEHKIKSKRQLDYARWKTEFDNYTEDKGFLTSDIAFGNTCNLKCIICSPSSSSRWRKEYQKLYGDDVKPVEVTNFTAENLYKNMPNIIHYDFGGGEPLLSETEKQHDLLQRYIENGKSKDMTLHYNTNGQQFPNNKFWEQWKHFKEVDIQLSIDGIYKQYEYVRFPGKYDKLENVVSQLVVKEREHDNIVLSVSHTVSAYNIYYLDDFFNWCTQVGLPKPWCGAVDTPLHMRPDLYPKKIRDVIVTKLRKTEHIDVLRWSKLISEQDSSKYFSDFLIYKDKHDVYRNTNFAKTFPELEELINEL